MKSVAIFSLLLPVGTTLRNKSKAKTGLFDDRVQAMLKEERRMFLPSFILVVETLVKVALQKTKNFCP